MNRPLTLWLTTIRFWILSFSLLLSVGIYVWLSSTIPAGNTQTVKLTETYAFLGLGFLYLSLLCTPLYQVFPGLPGQALYIKARRALGVSAFLFSALHSGISFFRQLEGISGLSFLSQNYLTAVIFGAIALFILALMTLTSLEWAVRMLSYPRWKLLHRLVYPAGLFIVIHSVMLGTHIGDLHTLVSKLCFLALAFLLFLEALRLDNYLQKRLALEARFGFIFLLFVSLFTFALTYYYPANPSSGGLVGIHAEHLQIARQAQQTNLNPNSPALQGLRGDRTKRFTVSFNHPSLVQAQQDTELRFQVFDASNGNPVSLYNKIYDKFVHLIIVDSSLHYFSHIHPSTQDGQFVITTQFPTDGTYHLYVDYQPLGAIEQQQAFTLKVGSGSGPIADQQADQNLSKQFGPYLVTLSTSAPLSAAQLSLGNQLLTFTLKDAASGRALTNLKPYLAAFGHLVMIQQPDFDYLHVHPNNLTVPAPDSSSGPEVQFLPLGLYGPIKPGLYRLFAQFNPDGHLFTADFTVKVDL